MQEVRLPDGRERLVRHGHGPERQMQTEIGPAAVQRGKLRDRAASAGGAGDVGAERIRFTSAILPRWARRVYQRGRRTQEDLAFSTFDHANQHRIPPLIHI